MMMMTMVMAMMTMVMMTMMRMLLMMMVVMMIMMMTMNVVTPWPRRPPRFCSKSLGFIRNVPGSMPGSAWLLKVAVLFSYRFCRASAWLKAWLSLARIRFHIGFARRVPGSKPGSAWLGFVFR